MKNYNYLVNKYFRVHKKRVLLTVLGIISSIILFFTIGYLNNYTDDINNIKYKEKNGDYDVAILDVNKEVTKKLVNNVKVEKSGLYKLESETKIVVGNVEKYMSVYMLDDTSLNDIFDLRLEIEEGRLPKSSNELIFNFYAKNQISIDIGDKVTIEGSEYEIVGFYKEEDTSSYYLNGVTYLNKNNIDNTVSVLLKVKNNHNKIKHIENIIKDGGLDFEDINDSSNIRLNSTILINNSQTDDKNIRVDEKVLILGALNLSVLILTIILTSSSINISLNERKKEFSTLRCIGATPSKIKALLIKESAILGLLSLIPGIIIAQFISWLITYTLINEGIDINHHIQGRIYFDVVIKTILLTALNIFFSTIIPVIKVSKLAPIDVVKREGIENNKIKKRNSKTIRKIFGYSGELAYKNIRANNKSFITTIITLTTILVIIICFSGYKIINDKNYEKRVNSLTDVIISFYLNNNNIENDLSIEEVMKESEEFVNGVKNLDLDSQLYSSTRHISKAILQGTTFNKNIKGYNDSQTFILDSQESIYSDELNLLVLDDEYIEKILPYINNGNKKINKLNNNDFIVVNKQTSHNLLNIKRVSPLLLNIGESINLYLPGENDVKKLENLQPIKMNYKGSIDNEDLICGGRFGYYNYLTLIVSEDFYLKNKDAIKISNHNNSLDIFMNIDKEQDKYVALKKIDEYAKMNNTYYIPEKSEEIKFKEAIDNNNMLIDLGLILIILISTINLINTRSINIYLREKEFKVLLAIGMKKSDLKKMIFLEGIVAWFISSCIGGVISVVILKIINIIYEYQGYVKDLPIPFNIVFISVIALFIVTIIVTKVSYYKFKNLGINNLINDEE